jgi:hypothetical protein
LFLVLCSKSWWVHSIWEYSSAVQSTWARRALGETLKEKKKEKDVLFFWFVALFVSNKDEFFFYLHENTPHWKFRRKTKIIEKKKWEKKKVFFTSKWIFALQALLLWPVCSAEH